MPIIRTAEAVDALRLSSLAEETFRASFAAMNTPDDMDLHCRSSYSEAIQASEISNPSMVTLLIEEADSLVGFAQLRWGAAPECVVGTAPGEIQRLYVVADWHGKRVAQDLMKASIDQMSRRGSDVVWLGVWERNPRAITFYRKFGFAEVGAHAFPVGTDLQRDIVMARAVAVSD